MSNIFFTSDLHFGHDKKFIYGARGFDSIEEHDEAIIANWNKVVRPEDWVFCLGDLMLGDNVKGLRNLAHLNGSIHVVRGNHDTNTRMDLYWNCDVIQEISEGCFYHQGKYSFYLCHFPVLSAPHTDYGPAHRIINLCGHSHTTDRFADWDKGLIYHCELDAHNMTPVAYEDILLDLRRKRSE